MARSRRPQPSKNQAPTPSARPWARLVAALAVVATLGGAAWWWLQPTPAGPIILISIDTLRADHLGLYGYTKGRTPNIDALARDGVVFDRAYAHAPQTLPSHTSILTGELPFEHGVRDNIGFTVKPGTPTLPGLLAPAGYGSGGFVSAYVLRKDTGLGQGFTVYNAEFPAGALDRPLAQVLHRILTGDGRGDVESLGQRDGADEGQDRAVVIDDEESGPLWLHVVTVVRTRRRHREHRRPPSETARSPNPPAGCRPADRDVSPVAIGKG